MQEDQRVADMAVEVLARQARARAQETGETFEGALKAVQETEAGRQLGELRGGPHRGERAADWQEDLPRRRAQERTKELAKEQDRASKEERSRAQKHAAWESFMGAERRELGLRKDGQLAGLLGEALAGEPPAALRRLADEDRRQAEEGLVALSSNGRVSYKHVEELREGDMPARSAANRSRTAWLKERRDGWLGRGEGRLRE